MNISKKYLIGALLLTTAIAASVTAFSTTSVKLDKEAHADTYELTITEELLGKTAIETCDWEFSDGTSQNEGKFRINLDNNNEKYIDGAILYRDCGHQSLGQYLSEDLVLANTDKEDQNANNYNFNIYFSVHGIASVSAYYSRKVYDASSSNDGTFSIYYIGANSIENYFKSKTHGFCKNYDTSSTAAADIHSWNSSFPTGWTQNTLSCNNGATGCGIFRIQISSTGFPYGQTARFHFKELTIKYTC